MQSPGFICAPSRAAIIAWLQVCLLGWLASSSLPLTASAQDSNSFLQRLQNASSGDTVTLPESFTVQFPIIINTANVTIQGQASSHRPVVTCDNTHTTTAFFINASGVVLAGFGVSNCNYSAVYVTPNAALCQGPSAPCPAFTLSDMHFDGNGASPPVDAAGGAVSMMGINHTLVVIGSKFEGNREAIFFEQAGKVTLLTTTFRSNYFVDHAYINPNEDTRRFEFGSAITMRNASANIRSCVFENNYNATVSTPMQNNAGTVRGQGGNLTMQGCRFFNNSGSTALRLTSFYGNNSGLEIDRCEFIANIGLTARTDGGALLFWNDFEDPATYVNITRSVFKSNGAGHHGGAFVLKGAARMYLTDLDVINNAAGNHSEPPNSEAGENLENATGGGLFVVGSFNTTTQTYGKQQLYMTRLNVSGNWMKQARFTTAAAASLYRLQYVGVADSTFVNNSGAQWGSVRFTEIRTINTTKCLFADNFARNEAGGVKVAVLGGGVAGFNNCVFRNNSATFYGGGMSAEALRADQYTTAVLALTNCTFDRNYLSPQKVPTTHGLDFVSGVGGAGLNMTGFLSLALDNCTFDSNNATVAGNGAGAWIGGFAALVNHSITRSVFKNNVGGSGGGIYMLGDPSNPATPAVLSIMDTTFTNNSASLAGGAIGMEYFSVSLTRTTLERNSVMGLLSRRLLRQLVSGGGIYMKGSDIAVDNCTFSANMAADPSWATAGGALHALASSVQMSGSLLVNNSANVGGAVKLEQYLGTTMRGCTFRHNRAVASSLSDMSSGYAGDGAALHADTTGDTGTGPERFLVDGCRFVGNLASAYGGAYSCVGCDQPSIVGSMFMWNMAKLDGGAVEFEQTACPIVVNTTFNSNSARHGGAMHMLDVGSQRCQSELPDVPMDVTDATVLILQTTLLNNSALRDGGAVFLDDFYGSAVIDRLFASGNTAGGSGGAVWVSTPEASGEYSYMHIHSSLLEQNSAVLDGGAVGMSGTQDLSMLDLVDVQLLNNSAGQYGGGVFAENAIILASTEPTNHTGQRRSLLYVMQLEPSLALMQQTRSLLQSSPAGSLPMEQGTLLKHNSAIRGGGLYCRNCPQVRLKYAAVTANNASGNGGGLALSTVRDLQMQEVVIADNVAGGIGGGAACEGCGHLGVQSSTVSGNSAAAGGGLHVASGSFGSFVALRSNFTRNTASLAAAVAGQRAASFADGGALALYVSLLVLADSVFDANAADDRGGAVLLENPYCSPDQGMQTLQQLLRNASSSGLLAGGQGVQCGSNAALLACMFENNVAGSSGGALFTTQRERLAVGCDDWDISGGNSTAASCTSAFFNNTVSQMSADIVGSPARLVVDDGGSLTPSALRMHSRDQLLPIPLMLVDMDGMLSTGTSGWLLTASVSTTANRSLSPRLLGALTTTLQRGVAQLQLELRATQGDYQITVAAPSIAGVQPATLAVHIVPCPMGSQESKATYICELCAGPLTYSFGNECHACPSKGATCRDGPQLVPQDGWWHSAANSTAMQRCPNPTACSGDRQLRQERLVACQSNWYQNLSVLTTTELQALPCVLWGLPDEHPRAYMLKQCAQGYMGRVCGVCDYRGIANSSRYGAVGSLGGFRCTQCPPTHRIAGDIVLTIVWTSAAIVLSPLNYIGQRLELPQDNIRAGDIVQLLVVHSQYLAILASVMTIRQWPSAGLLALLRATESVTGLTSTSYLCLLPTRLLECGFKAAAWQLGLMLMQAAAVTVVGLLSAVLIAWAMRWSRRRRAARGMVTAHRDGGRDMVLAKYDPAHVYEDIQVPLPPRTKWPMVSIVTATSVDDAGVHQPPPTVPCLSLGEDLGFSQGGLQPPASGDSGLCYMLRPPELSLRDASGLTYAWQSPRMSLPRGSGSQVSLTPSDLQPADGSGLARFRALLVGDAAGPPAPAPVFVAQLSGRDQASATALSRDGHVVPAAQLRQLSAPRQLPAALPVPPAGLQGSDGLQDVSANAARAGILDPTDPLSTAYHSAYDVTPYYSAEPRPNPHPAPARVDVLGAVGGAPLPSPFGAMSTFCIDSIPPRSSPVAATPDTPRKSVGSPALKSRRSSESAATFPWGGAASSSTLPTPYLSVEAAAQAEGEQGAGDGFTHGADDGAAPAGLETHSSGASHTAGRLGDRHSAPASMDHSAPAADARPPACPSSADGSPAVREGPQGGQLATSPSTSYDSPPNQQTTMTSPFAQGSKGLSWDTHPSDRNPHAFAVEGQEGGECFLEAPLQSRGPEDGALATGSPPKDLHTELLEACIASLLAALFVLYPTLLNICFSVFACYKLDKPSRDEPYPSNQLATWEHGYLGLDMRVECYRGYHKSTQVPAAAAGLALLCLIVPGILLVLLTWHRHHLTSDNSLLRSMGILYRAYRPQCYWWGLAALQPLTAALVGVKVLLLSAQLSASDILVVLMALLLLYTLIALRLRPFRWELQHQLHVQSLFVLILTAALAIIVVNASSGDYLLSASDHARDGAMITILVVNLMSYLLMIAMLFGVAWDERKENITKIVRSVHSAHRNLRRVGSRASWDSRQSQALQT